MALTGLVDNGVPSLEGITAEGCMIALLGKVAFEEFTGTGGDPSRTLHGIVTGIGFLGAGSIIKGEGGRTEGLTTPPPKNAAVTGNAKSPLP